MIKYEEYWPTTVAEVQLDAALADKIEEAVVPRLNVLEDDVKYTASGSRHHGRYTSRNTAPMITDWLYDDDRKIQIHELVPEFIEKISESVLAFSKHTKIYVKDHTNIEYWTQDYKDNHYHPQHAHGTSGISGTYYVRANESAGPICFYNHSTTSSFVKCIDEESTELNKTRKVKAEKGKLLLFPSYLQHRVMECGPNAIRTSISFNCYYK